MSYTHLSACDRGRVQALHDAGHSVQDIAEAVGRHRTTIRRGLARHGGTDGYRADAAHKRYQTRRVGTGRRSQGARHPGHVADHVLAVRHSD